MRLARIAIPFLISILLAGCADVYKSGADITPPAQITPIPPSEILDGFIKSYNKRDAEAIYEMMPDRLKANYSLKDFERELEFAELRNITVVQSHVKRELINGDLRVLIAELRLNANGKILNLTIDFPVLYIPYELKEDNRTHARGLKGRINSWIFDSLHSFR